MPLMIWRSTPAGEADADERGREDNRQRREVKAEVVAAKNAMPMMA